MNSNSSSHTAAGGGATPSTSNNPIIIDLLYDTESEEELEQEAGLRNATLPPAVKPEVKEEPIGDMGSIGQNDIDAASLPGTTSTDKPTDPPSAHSVTTPTTDTPGAARRYTQQSQSGAGTSASSSISNCEPATAVNSPGKAHYHAFRNRNPALYRQPAVAPFIDFRDSDLFKHCWDHLNRNKRFADSPANDSQLGKAHGKNSRIKLVDAELVWYEVLRSQPAGGQGPCACCIKREQPCVIFMYPPGPSGPLIRSICILCYVRQDRCDISVATFTKSAADLGEQTQARVSHEVAASASTTHHQMGAKQLVLHAAPCRSLDDGPVDISLPKGPSRQHVPRPLDVPGASTFTTPHCRTTPAQDAKRTHRPVEASTGNPSGQRASLPAAVASPNGNGSSPNLDTPSDARVSNVQNPSLQTIEVVPPAPTTHQTVAPPNGTSDPATGPDAAVALADDAMPRRSPSAKSPLTPVRSLSPVNPAPATKSAAATMSAADSTATGISSLGSPPVLSPATFPAPASPSNDTVLSVPDSLSMPRANTAVSQPDAFASAPAANPARIHADAALSSVSGCVPVAPVTASTAASSVATRAPTGSSTTSNAIASSAAPNSQPMAPDSPPRSTPLTFKSGIWFKLPAVSGHADATKRPQSVPATPSVQPVAGPSGGSAAPAVKTVRKRGHPVDPFQRAGTTKLYEKLSNEQLARGRQAKRRALGLSLDDDNSVRSEANLARLSDEGRETRPPRLTVMRLTRPSSLKMWESLIKLCEAEARAGKKVAADLLRCMKDETNVWGLMRDPSGKYDWCCTRQYSKGKDDCCLVQIKRSDGAVGDAQPGEIVKVAECLSCHLGGFVCGCAGLCVVAYQSKALQTAKVSSDAAQPSASGSQSSRSSRHESNAPVLQGFTFGFATPSQPARQQMATPPASARSMASSPCLDAATASSAANRANAAVARPIPTVLAANGSSAGPRDIEPAAAAHARQDLQSFLSHIAKEVDKPRSASDDGPANMMSESDLSFLRKIATTSMKRLDSGSHGREEALAAHGRVWAFVERLEDRLLSRKKGGEGTAEQDTKDLLAVVDIAKSILEDWKAAWGAAAS